MKYKKVLNMDIAIRLATSVIILFYVIVVVVLTWDRVRDVAVEQDTAALIFTAATVQIGIAITLIFKTWNTFVELGNKIPTGQRRFRLDTRDVENVDERETYTTLWMLGTVNICLALCILAQIATLMGVGDIMLDLNPGPIHDSNEENYRWGLFAGIWGLTFFTSGLIAAGFVYGFEALRFMVGQKSVIFPHDTDPETIGPQENKKTPKWKIGVFVFIVIIIFSVTTFLSWDSDPKYGSLDGRVSHNNDILLISNNNSNDWVNVDITINGLYFDHIDRIAIGEDCTLPLSDFTKSDGTRFDPNTIMVQEVVVEADDFKRGMTSFE